MSDVDERLVHALCAAAATEPGASRSRGARPRPPSRPARRRRRRRTPRARRGRPPRRPRLARRAARRRRRRRGPRQRTAARSGSTAPGRSTRAGTIAAADLAVVIERILAPLGRRARPHHPDRRRPAARWLPRVRGRRRRSPSTAPACRCAASATGRCRSPRSPPTPSAPCSTSCSTAAATSIVSRRHVVGQDLAAQSMLGRTRPGERIVTLEDTAELLPAADHLVRLEARPATPTAPPPSPLEQLRAHGAAPAPRPPRGRRGARGRGARRWSRR